jgi:hypothetical protein
VNVGDLVSSQFSRKSALDGVGAALIGGAEGILGVIVPDTVVKHVFVGAKDEPADDPNLGGLLEAAFSNGTGGLSAVDDRDALNLVLRTLLADRATQGGDAVVVGSEMVRL